MTPLDLGHDVTLEYTSWRDHERAGFLQHHHRPGTGADCWSGGLFDVPGVREHFPERALWQVTSWEPLTLTPSLLCTICGHHGFVTGGRWVPA